jgi:hypothetical protein
VLITAKVVSLAGVVLIARPPILFGNGSMSMRSEGTAAERMVAVGFDVPLPVIGVDAH